MNKTIIAIGGGELKIKETLQIDKIIAEEAKIHSGDKRACALFIGAASHDSMPYYNTFHKTYTGELGLKTDCALTVYGEMNYGKIKDKFEKADMIYVGGGDTVYMLKKWKESGIDKLIINAYDRGVIIAGISAGAICWFENMFSDFEIMEGKSSNYTLLPAMGLIKGAACPHYNERKDEFKKAVLQNKIADSVCIENNSAVIIRNGVIEKSLSSGGQAYRLKYFSGNITEEQIL